MKTGRNGFKPSNYSPSKIKSKVKKILIWIILDTILGCVLPTRNNSKYFSAFPYTFHNNALKVFSIIFPVLQMNTYVLNFIPPLSSQ